MELKKYTIIEAAIEVLRRNNNEEMSIREIFAKIEEDSLYTFHAKNPLSALSPAIRCHASGIDFPTASPVKYFKYHEASGKYTLCNNGDSIRCSSGDEIREDEPCYDIESDYSKIKSLHTVYVNSFKKSLLEQIKNFSPYEFEKFCKNLLPVYGFEEMKVTQQSKDGGIDGVGKLKVGIAYMSIAFQCKRWDNGKVGRKEIDAFRGAIQGEYEQGIFFTTSSFTKEATGASIKKGAVPIILIDGEMIVDIMIKNHFGVDSVNLPIYISALDNSLVDKD